MVKELRHQHRYRTYMDEKALKMRIEQKEKEMKEGKIQVMSLEQ